MKLKSFVCILIAALAFAVSAEAQRKKVGVVLSGGGAKGVAHISCLKVLEEAGIPIDYITGTSMGAIIGGLYSIGYSPQMLDSLVRTQDWPSLIYDRVPRSDLSFGAKEREEKYLLTVGFTPDRKLALSSGLISGNNVYNLLYELTYGYHDSIPFNELPVPFACMAYDMVTGRVVTQDSGYLTDAIRASMSIPGAFQAVRRGDMVLVDGGIGNNFPADIVKEMGAEIIIGIDVGAPLRTKDELNNPADIFDQITSFTGLESYENNKKLVDLYIHPDIEGYSAASFSAEAIDTLIRRGEEAAMAKWDEIVALKDKIGVPVDFRLEPVEPIALSPAIEIGEIRIEGLRSENEKTLRRLMKLKENSVINGSDIRRAVSRLRGVNSISDVHYRLESDSTHTLVFIIKERPDNSISLGFRFDTEEMAAILLNIRYAAKNMTNSYFDITGRLGKNPYGTIGYHYGNETQRKFSFSYSYRYNDLSLYDHGKRVVNLDFSVHTVDINFSNIKLRDFRASLGVRYDYYDTHSQLNRNVFAGQFESDGIFRYYGMLHYETMDHRYYPRRGVSLRGDYSLNTSNFLTYHDSPPFSVLHLDFSAAVSVNKRFTFLPGVFGRVIIGENIAYQMNNFMGGPVAGRYLPHQMPFIGLSKFERFDKSVVGARMEVRVRMWRKNYVSMKANYAKHQDNFFKLPDGEDVFGYGLNFSYDSFIGPIDLLLDYSHYDKKFGVYFNLGYYF